MKNFVFFLVIICIVVSIVCVIQDKAAMATYFIGLGCINYITAAIQRIEDKIDQMKK